MNRKDILKMCIQNLKRRRSRTLLTLLGVLIGCCSIVIMVSIGIGMAESQNRMLAEMGDLTIITVTPKQNGKGKIKLNDSALGQIRHMEHVAAVTPKLNLESMNAPSGSMPAPMTGMWQSGPPSPASTPGNWTGWATS